VLEIGGGQVQMTTRNLRERSHEIVGIDVDNLIKANRLLDKAVVYDGGKFPLPDGTFDVAVSRWVNEHLTDPETHFREVSRVLKPGGVYVFRTVNLYSYKALAALITPHSIQVPLVNWLAHRSSEDHDPYVTYYRANTRRRIKALCRTAGLVSVTLRITESYPAYGMSSKMLFRIMMGYERIVNSSALFEALRHTIDCVATKPSIE
jgi:ubiquinone/menaquinone biosynthesis C-methylase UbiE